MRRLLVTGVIGLALGAGCSYTISDFDDALPATLQEVDRIRNDVDLSAQQKRSALEELDFPPSSINALLREERTANQFGGDLRSAWEKVSGERFNELTPDEIQLYADAGNETDVKLPFDLTDEAAQAMVDLFAEYSIATKEDLQAFLDGPSADIPSSIPTGALQEIFIDFDPNELADALP